MFMFDRTIGTEYVRRLRHLSEIGTFNDALQELFRRIADYIEYLESQNDRNESIIKNAQEVDLLSCNLIKMQSKEINELNELNLNLKELLADCRCDVLMAAKYRKDEKKHTLNRSDIIGYSYMYGNDAAKNLLFLCGPDAFDGDYYAVMKELNK